MSAAHLLVVGAQRSGTTYLTRVLDAHEQITFARPARPEPKVFCSDDLSSRGREWYVEQFFAHATPGQVLGEKSTSYLEDPLAPARAQAMLGDGEVTVVAQLRDPVARAVSNWRFSTDNGLETLSLEDALVADLDGPERPWDSARTSVSPYAYVRRGRYADYLRAWTDTFGAAVHVLFLPETVEDPAALAPVYAALGVDADRAGATAGPLDGRVNASSVAEPGLDAGLVARLRDFYAEPDARLGELLGRDLPWPTGGRTTTTGPTTSTAPGREERA